jgi:assimilatory nitrate reductase catalytic subunit
MEVGTGTAQPAVRARDFPVNNGALCIKGWTAADTLAHPDRLRTPLGRNAAGRLGPISWDEALDRLVAAIGRA